MLVASILPFVFWTACAAVLMVYVGYPVSLRLLVYLFGRRITVGTCSPSVTLIISAYNEAGVIGRKLENALAMDYPPDKLEIMVISDCSSDGTDEIVKSYEDRGVRLCRLPEQRGKSHGLTRFVPQAKGDIIVFTDANAMYDPQALRLLLKHFSDPQTGYVVGSQRYERIGESQAAASEGLYANHEEQIKTLESRLSSVVGGDGAIYSIRKGLFRPLRDDDISDFVNPLQIVAAGFRGVFEPAARCYEEPSGAYIREFRRKVRIVNRSLRALWRTRAVLNPFRVGWFAYQVTFHKLFRWCIPYFLATILLANVLLCYRETNVLYQATLAMQLIGYGLAAAYSIPVLRRFRLIYLAYYFVVVNCAAAVGVWLFLCGRRISTWQPERAKPVPESMS